MKKVLSILLALIIALSAFSTAAFAADVPKTKTEALLDKLYTATELQVSFTPDKKFASDLPMSAITVYAKGNDIAVDTKLGFLPVRAVKTGDACYAYSPLLPFAYLSIDSKVIDGIIGDKDIWEYVHKTVDSARLLLAYVKSYDEKIGDETYLVEEFNDREHVTTKFYYKGDMLKLINVYNESDKTTQVTTINDYSFTVDAAVFKAPAGIDLTKLLKLFGFIKGLPLAA